MPDAEPISVDLPQGQSMMFSQAPLPESRVRELSLRVLAHLGDAVFHLYEREREVTQAVTVKDMHRKMVVRASALNQADILDQIAQRLTAPESDLVRRARNVRSRGQHKAGQSVYRKSTAFEALVGYLYLTDSNRLLEILKWTHEPAGSA